MFEILSKLASMERTIQEIRGALLNDPKNREMILTALLFDEKSRVDVTPAAWDDFAKSKSFLERTELGAYKAFGNGIGQFGFPGGPTAPPLTLHREALDLPEAPDSDPSWGLTIESAAKGYRWCLLELMLDWETCFKLRHFILILRASCTPRSALEVHTYYEKLGGEQVRGSYSYSFLTEDESVDIHEIDFAEIDEARDKINFKIPPRVMLSLPANKAFRFGIESCRIYTMR